jgi:hypothetical protein
MAKKLYTNEEVNKKYDSLPEEIKDFLYSFEMTSIITKVGEKNALHIDQMDRLNTETGYVMMGLTETKDFPAIIADDLQIDAAKAQAVAKDIEEMLFSKIRDAMKQAPAPASKPPLREVLPTASSSLPATPAPTSVEIPPKIEKIEVKPSDMMLAEPTVAQTPEIAIQTQDIAPAAPPTAPKTEPPKPQDYKADPYREPVN